MRNLIDKELVANQQNFSGVAFSAFTSVQQSNNINTGVQVA